MKNLFTLLLLITTSCSDILDESHISIDPKLKSFYNSFIKEGKKRGYDLSNKDITIMFDTLTYGLEGITTHGTIPLIRVNYKFFKNNEKTFFQNSDSTNWFDVQYTIFHELGHALLYRSHTDKWSIMDCCAWSRGDYLDTYKKRQQLITELFNEQ